MRADARLNLLLTTPPQPASERGAWAASGAPPWHRTVSQLLIPLGVRTFEARCGNEAVELMEKHPIHLAVVDTRLPSIGGMNVLQLMQRLGEQKREDGGRKLDDATPETSAHNPEPAPDAGVGSFAFRMRMEQHGTGRHIQVRFDARIEPGDITPGAMPASRPVPSGPVVILIAPPPQEQDKQLLQEALKFNAFSVLNEPVDVNVALQVMARAVTRCFAGLWPT